MGDGYGGLGRQASGRDSAVLCEMVFATSQGKHVEVTIQ